jgi:hypothetical protein
MYSSLYLHVKFLYIQPVKDPKERKHVVYMTIHSCVRRYLTVNLLNYCADQIKKNEMSTASTRRGTTAYTTVVRKAEGKRQLDRPKHRKKEDIKWSSRRDRV